LLKDITLKKRLTSEHLYTEKDNK